MIQPWPILILTGAIAIASSFYLQSCQQKGKAYTSTYRLASPKHLSQTLAPSSLAYQYRQVFKSSTHRTVIPYTIMLPASYSVNSESRYPIILWLHGAAGGHRSIIPLTSRFQRAMDLGMMQESIIVFPESRPLSMWVNSKDNAYMIEDIIIKEFFPYVMKSYKVLPGENNATVAGFSMGGYGAARFGLKYPQIFSNIVMIGAGTLDQALDNTPRADPVIRDNVLSSVFGSSDTYFYQQSPRYYANKNISTIKKMSLKITVIVGTDDEVLDQNQRFFNYLESLGIHTTLALLPGVRHSLKDYFTFGTADIFRSF